MTLTRCTLADHSIVATWAATADDLSNWASLDQPPSESVFAQWLAAQDSQCWILRGELQTDNAPTAYGELWISEEENEVELARLLVDPRRRGQGVGRALVSALLGGARMLPVATAWVRVVPSNRAALRCYTASGFTYAAADEEERYNAEQPRGYRWLRFAL